MDSKYIKEKGSGSNSKYIKNKDDRGYGHSHRSGDNRSADGLSGRARYLEMLEREQEMKDTLELIEGDHTAQERIAKREAAKKAAAKQEAAKKRDENEKKSSGKAASKLKITQGAEGSGVAFSSSNEIEAKPLANEDEDDKVFRKVIIRNIITCSILAVISFLLQIASFHVPLTPSMTRLDLSAIPELLAAVSFGPIAGVAIIIIKNLFYVLILGNAVTATAVSNVILDSIFVGVASFIFARGMFSPMAIEKRMMEDPEGMRDARVPMIIKSGLIGALVTTPISYFAVMNVVYPLIFRLYNAQGYNEAMFVAEYNKALHMLNSYLPSPLNGIVTEITTLSKGVMVYNLPITFAKLMFVTIFVAIVFRWLSKVLFYRPNIDPDDVAAMRKKQQAQHKK